VWCGDCAIRRHRSRDDTPEAVEKEASMKKKTRRYWSAKVTERSDALDLESSVFKRGPAAIARSLKRSAERSTRRKATPFRSAMSMLTFYQNRAGKNLPLSKQRVIAQAKVELRKLYGR
jgi:hypothetical protein